MGMNRLLLLRALAGFMSAAPLDHATPLQKEFFEGRKSGRPKINKDRPKPERAGPEYLSKRHKRLATALVKLSARRKYQDKHNKYFKSHRTPAQQDVRDNRIIHITAKRFNVQHGEQFPLQAIIKMADLGVGKAIEQYIKMAEFAALRNISIREFHEQFVLGKAHES